MNGLRKTTLLGRSLQDPIFKLDWSEVMMYLVSEIQILMMCGDNA